MAFRLFKYSSGLSTSTTFYVKKRKFLRMYPPSGRIAFSTVPSLKDSENESESLYPPVRPRFPPGKWKRICEESAWSIHDYSHKLLKVSTAKERLEAQAGDVSKTLWLVEALSPRPNNLDFQKILTKTQLMPSEPEAIKNISVDDLVTDLGSIAAELFKEESDMIIHGKSQIVTCELDADKELLHNFFKSLLRNVVGLLSANHSHLSRCEIDENVRVESFWRVIGFEGEEKVSEGTWDIAKSAGDVDAGVLQFHYKHKADFQLRTEQPLQEFLSIHDSSCFVKETVTPQYAPDTVAMKPIKERPINVSGHWIGSPCEFTSGSIHIMPSKFVEEYEEYGMPYLEEAEVHMAMTSMFGSCVAQAHNQGFCDVLDLTYPITTQSIICNKHNIRFGYYQLNTMQLWNEQNSLQNLMWLSDKIKLFDVDEKTGTRQISKAFFMGFLKFLLLKPQNTGIDLRPFLPEEKSPVSRKHFINTKGEDHFPEVTIGRWQYPKYSIYF